MPHTEKTTLHYACHFKLQKNKDKEESAERSQKGGEILPIEEQG